jgi:hypothetical protein
LKSGRQAHKPLPQVVEDVEVRLEVMQDRERVVHGDCRRRDARLNKSGLWR